jgi:hypothetical protein
VAAVVVQVLLEEMQHTKLAAMEVAAHRPLSQVLTLCMQAEAEDVLMQDLLDLAELEVAAQLQTLALEHPVLLIPEVVEVAVAFPRVEAVVQVSLLSVTHMCHL